MPIYVYLPLNASKVLRHDCLCVRGGCLRSAHARLGLFELPQIKASHVVEATRGDVQLHVRTCRRILDGNKMSTKVPWSSLMSGTDNYQCVPSATFMQKPSMKRSKKTASENNKSESQHNGGSNGHVEKIEENGLLKKEKEMMAAAER